MSENHPKLRGISPRLDILLTLWLAFSARAISLTAQGLWRDEVDQWRFALQPWAEMAANFTKVGWNGPLYSPLVRAWIALTGESVYALRYLSLLWGVLGVALIYALARRLLDARAARWAVLLMALSPYMVWYAQEVKMYTWVPLLVLLALYALERACVTAQRRWWLTMLVATSLAFYSHILAALLIPVIYLWVWLHPRRHPRALRRGWWAPALLVLPYLPLLAWQAPLLLQVRETGFPPYALHEMALTLLNGWLVGIYQGEMLVGGNVGIGIILAMSALAFLGAIELVARGRERLLYRLGIWMGVPLLALWFVSLRGPIFTDRYLIWAAPALYLLVAAGLAVMQRRMRRAWPALFLLLTGLWGFRLVEQAIYPIKPQFDHAADYLATARDPDALLLFQIPYNHHVIDYYFRRRGDAHLFPWAEAPFTNWRAPDGDYDYGMPYVDGQMRGIVADYREVWLVYSEVPLWDERELVRIWLDTRGAVADKIPLHGVTLYRYELQP